MRKDRPDTRRGEQHNAAREEPRDRDVLKENVKAHPAGTAAGAAAGAVVGGAIGLGAGPVGGALGAGAGAVLGAVRGSGAREANVVTIAREDTYWREHYAERDYTGAGASYDDWGPAYRHAVALWLQHDGQRTWDDSRNQLAAGWHAAKEGSRLSWKDAEVAARDAWQRLDEVTRHTPARPEDDNA